jgi:hypothetical protein
MDTAIVVITTLVAVGASLYMFALNNIKDLKDNWAEYRCNPAYMPLAGMVGQDPFKNFNDCTMKSFQDYTGFVIGRFGDENAPDLYRNPDGLKNKTSLDIIEDILYHYTKNL